MKGKIDKDGFLKIQRGDDFKDQACPFRNDILQSNIIEFMPGETNCGCWCPLFGEPKSESELVAGETILPVSLPSGKILLQICQNHVLGFDEFEDAR